MHLERGAWEPRLGNVLQVVRIPTARQYDEPSGWKLKTRTCRFKSRSKARLICPLRESHRSSFQNYDGGTFLTDLVTALNFSDISEEIYERCLSFGPALVRNRALDCTAGGVRVQVPFFRPIAPTRK